MHALQAALAVILAAFPRVTDDYQFFTNPDLEYSAADWDRKHNFSVATTYELPFRRNDPWLGGWSLNQTTILQSGLPFNVTYRNAGSDRDG